jgi:hypothetical protein
MNLPKAYNEVSKRSLEASHAALSKGLQEYSGFLSYHAFESAGGALCSANHHPYPKSHISKINAFKTVANQRGNGLAVATVAIVLHGLRNPLLYPEVQANGSITEPQGRLTIPMARKLMKRVGGIVRWVRTNT